jgi:hypothetical protein
MTTSIEPPVFADNMRVVGYTDQGGRPDGVQVMVERGFAYVGHIFSKGFSIIDVRDPANPRQSAFVPAPNGSWTLHLQTHGDLLLVVNARDMFAAPEFSDERAYYRGSITETIRQASPKREWTAGLTIYDISKPGNPVQIGHLSVEGGGVHRVWYTGGRWAYMSVLLDGFSDYIFMVVDLADPAKPVAAGRYWIPGMNLAAGETPSWESTKRFGLHHPIIHGDFAYCAWRDAGLVMLDIADRSKPKLHVHRNWSPPFGGGTHNCLPLPDRNLLVVLDEAVLDHQEDGLKLIWIFDTRVSDNPISISTCPTPSDAPYVAHPGHFGPHNLHENRPGSFISSTLIFSTYQNAGIRIFDIDNAFQPKQVGALVPSPPRKVVDPRLGRKPVIQSADIFVDKSGLIYCTDYNAGLYVAEFGG